MAHKQLKSFFKFGEKLVYAEPSWYQHWESPYYNDSHRAFRAKVRQFVDKILPNVDKWDEDAVLGKEPPAHEIVRMSYEAGVYSSMWPVELGGTPPNGGFDAFHDLVFTDETSRLPSGTIVVHSVIGIALPPVVNARNPLSHPSSKRSSLAARL